MALNDYLAKAYGPKKRVKTKDGGSQASRASFDVVDASQQLVIPESRSSRSKEKRTKRGLWKNLDTNEVTEAYQEVAEPSGGGSVAPACEGSGSVGHKDSDNAQVAKKAHETVYRDEQGARIEDYESFAREKAQGEERAKEVELQRLRELNMGDIQLRQLREPGWVPETRGYSETNVEDPANMYQGGGDAAEVRVSPLGRKLYSGLCMENRFGIMPGARWDGVDRSTGFEKRWFQKKAELDR